MKKSVKKTAPKTSKASAARSGKKTAKTPLTKKQLQEFQALLLEKRKSILGDMNGIQAGALGRNLQESSGDLSNMPTHPADIGSDNFEHEFTLGLLESERALLYEINEALERIQEGSYGLCLGTGDPIGLPRLKARPWCKYCIEYQKMIEKGLVRPGQEHSYDEPDEEDEENEEDEMEDQENQED
ncbi:MAG: TraR/DksA family transcriptional regulator [Phycisphaerae bacterium]|nr:TraR/DksA family transcriptional regulator [Phycisphaerae bacterium]